MKIVTIPYSFEMTQLSVPSIFVDGINIKFPNFITTAIILNIENISSELKPKISNAFFVYEKFFLSSSVGVPFFNISYLSTFLWSFNDSENWKKNLVISVEVEKLK